MVGEFFVDEIIEILYGLRECYEQYYKLKILDIVLEVVVKLLDCYISDCYLLDKVIDLIDEVGFCVCLINF